MLSLNCIDSNSMCDRLNYGGMKLDNIIISQVFLIMERIDSHREANNPTPKYFTHFCLIKCNDPWHLYLAHIFS